MQNQIKIGEKIIGSQNPCFIIAEAGVNHNGDVALAKKLIDAAVEAGANAVKFQTFKTENVVTLTAEKAEYQKTTTGTAESQYEMIKKLEPEDDWLNMPESGDTFCTPFDGESADLLTRSAYRRSDALGEITNFS